MYLPRHLTVKILFLHSHAKSQRMMTTTVIGALIRRKGVHCRERSVSCQILRRSFAGEIRFWIWTIGRMKTTIGIQRPPSGRQHRRRPFAKVPGKWLMAACLYRCQISWGEEILELASLVSACYRGRKGISAIDSVGHDHSLTSRL